jgi:hypothetical protein
MTPARNSFLLVAAATLVAFAAGLGLGLGLGLHSRGAAGHDLCAANPCRLTMTRNGAAGLVIKDASGPRVENPLLIVDPDGLAEFWQNAAGAYEGPRGEICTTNAELAPVACLGSDGTTGWIRIGNQVLTSGDLAWMHSAEGATRPAAQPQPDRATGLRSRRCASTCRPAAP